LTNAENIAIQIKELKKYYGTFKGCEDVSFDVNFGEVVGFVGPNGAGKSTVIKALLGLIIKTSGTATILGEDANIRADIRQRVGYASSDSIFYKNMRVKNLLEFTAAVYGKGADTYAKYAKRLDLDLNKRIDQLSLGNRKKVSIVNSLMTEADILILDEPTNGLDPLVQKEFYAMISESKKRGAAILLSTHILADVQSYCDRAVIIKDGLIVADSTVQSLVSGSKESGKVVKDVLIVFENSMPDFSDVSGMENMTMDGLTLKGHFSGNMSDLLGRIGSASMSQFSVSDLNLDSIVHDYYDAEKIGKQ
jgi:ABC-2 type transport system ATP-binding protein